MSEYVKRLRPRVTLGATKRLSSCTELRRVVKKSKIKAETSRKRQKKSGGKKSQRVSEHPTLLSTSSRTEVAPIVQVPGKAFQQNGENRKRKKKLMYKRTKGEVHDFLHKVGVEDLDTACLCLKAGIKNKCVNIDGPNPLENVILKTKCYMCEREITVKLGDVLYQGPSGGNYWGGSDTDIICPNEDCSEHFIVTGMCTPQPELSDGKFHNHCDMCPGFGECIGDYRQSHCSSCGEHYFAGSMDQFKCTTCYSSSEGEDDEFRSILYSQSNQSVKNSIFSYLYKELETTRFDLLQVTSQTDLGEGDNSLIAENDTSQMESDTETMN